MENKSLVDSFRISGSDLKSFKTAVKDMDESTVIVPVKGRDIVFLSLCEVEKYQVPGKLSFYILSPENLDDFLKKGLTLKVGTIPIEKIGEELAEQIKTTTGLVAVIKDKDEDAKYLVSQMAMKTLTRQTCLGGDEMINDGSFARNLYLAKAVFTKNARLNLVVRQSQTAKVIQAVFKGRYAKFEQNRLVKTVEEMEGNLVKWEMTHSVTRVWVEIPEYTKGFPEEIAAGFMLQTSDTGYYDMSATSFIKLSEDKYLYLDREGVDHCHKALTSNLTTMTRNVLKSVPQALVDIRQYFDGPAIKGTAVERCVEDYMRAICNVARVPIKRVDAVFADKDKIDKIKPRYKPEEIVFSESLKSEYTPFEVLTLKVKAVNALESNGLDEPTTERLRFSKLF